MSNTLTEKSSEAVSNLELSSAKLIYLTALWCNWYLVGVCESWGRIKTAPSVFPVASICFSPLNAIEFKNTSSVLYSCIFYPETES